MQNQSSPAQLLFPTVPNSFCPSGDWASIFNSFITLYLNNGTVNIPGLGQVTPQQIQTINQNIQNIQNTLNAYSGYTGNQTITTATTAQTFTLTWATAFPNTNYQIIVNFLATAGTGASGSTGPLWSVVAGSQTTTSVKVWVYNNNSDIASFNWSVFIIPS